MERKIEVEKVVIRPPRPVAGWTVFALGLLLRAWALPFVAVSWLVGTVALACAAGFGLAWEMTDLGLARALREGKSKLRRKRYDDEPIELGPDDDWDDDDEYGDEY